VRKYVTNYRITITTDNGVVHFEEREYPSLDSAVYRALHKGGIALGDLKEAQSASMGFTIAVECLLNRPKPRAPRRPPEVIAQEKQARLDAAQKRAQEEAKYAQQRQEQEDKLAKAKRRRITQQIDHAFMTGHESGSEPVSKYITCDTCSSPADFIYVNAPLAPGAAVLDETTITDAVCALHNGAANQRQRQYHYKHVADIVPCSRLEFFYTGIRQIAIKAV
jgi:hypothetical protein